MVGSAVARLVLSSEPMNTGSIMPMTIRRASLWESEVIAGGFGAGVHGSGLFRLGSVRGRPAASVVEQPRPFGQRPADGSDQCRLRMRQRSIRCGGS